MDAAAERKPRASTRGAPPPRERRYSSDSATCCFALATCRSASAHNNQPPYTAPQHLSKARPAYGGQ